MGNTCKKEKVSAVESPSFKITPQLSIRKDEDGRKTVNQYTILRKIGKGSFGRVYMVMDDDGVSSAMKLLDKRDLRKKLQPNGKSALDGVRKEVQIMTGLDHPNIVKLREVIDDPNGKYFCIIMEFCSNGKILSLRHIRRKAKEEEEEEEGEKEGEDSDKRPNESSESDFEEEDEEEKKKPLKRFKLSKIFRIFHDTVLGLQYLHGNGIYHSDIKPENLLVDGNERIKISDFGVSMKFDLSSQQNIKIRNSNGTPSFQPPEVLIGENEFDPFLVDIWSLGVTLYVLLFLELPFEGDSYKELTKSVSEDELKFPENQMKEIKWIDPEIQESTKKFLRKMLEKNVEERYQNMEEIVDSEWFGRVTMFLKNDGGDKSKQKHPTITVE